MAGARGRPDGEPPVRPQVCCAGWGERPELAGWKSRLRRKKPAQAPEPVRFVELAVEPAATGNAGVLELIVGGVVVRVRGRVEEDALARVLAVLEARR